MHMHMHMRMRAHDTMCAPPAPRGRAHLQTFSSTTHDTQPRNGHTRKNSSNAGKP